MKRMVAFLIVAAALSLFAASTAGATHTGQLCRSFKQGGHAYSWETVGTGWTCGSAKPWVVKLIGDHARVVSKNVPLKNGPRGYHCYAIAGSRRGRATNGACWKGTIAFPISGFSWLEK